MKFIASAEGRRQGAIGRFYDIGSLEIDEPNAEAAKDEYRRRKYIEGYEHVQHVSAKELKV